MLRFSSNLEYRADGSSGADVLTTIEEEDGNNLAYFVAGNGTWKINGNRIEDTTRIHKLERRHSPKAVAWLAESKDAQLLDNMVYDGLKALLNQDQTDSVTVAA